MKTFYYSQILKIARNIGLMLGQDIRRTSIYQYDIGNDSYVKATRQGGKIKINSSREFDFEECVFSENTILLLNRNKPVAELFL